MSRAPAPGPSCPPEGQLGLPTTTCQGCSSRLCSRCRPSVTMYTYTPILAWLAVSNIVCWDRCLPNSVCHDCRPCRAPIGTPHHMGRSKTCTADCSQPNKRMLCKDQRDAVAPEKLSQYIALTSSRERWPGQIHKIGRHRRRAHASRLCPTGGIRISSALGQTTN